MSTPTRRASDAQPFQRVVRFLSRNGNKIVGSVLVALAVFCALLAVGLEVNNRGDAARERNQRAEAQRTCRRSYLLGPAFADFYRRNGLDPRAVRIYVQSIPSGKNVGQACP